MARDMTPVLKRCRSLGIDPTFLGLDKKSNRNARAGRKQSEYGLQLKEKQKAKFIYGVLEKPFRNNFARAQKLKYGTTGENLMIILELRLDNVLFRMGYGRTRKESRQIIDHKHVLVNGKCVNIPSYEVKPGDVITEAQADAFFESDIRAVENQVNALPLHLGQYQFDAVVSFCFNVGIGKFKKSTLYKKIRADAYDSSIPAEFKKWIYGGGKILPGLVTRREWEAKRYQGLTI